MKLYIIHMRFTRRRLLLTAAALVLVTGMTLLLAGCFRSSTPCEEVELATNDQRVATCKVWAGRYRPSRWRRWISSCRRI